MTRIVYIGVGSNLGEKLNNCRKGIELIANIEHCKIKAQSGFYRTEPVGVKGQDWYINGVICVETGLSPQALLQSLLAIEAQMGRQRRRRWDSRIIDLDILLFGHEIINEKDLNIPHPYMHLRKFVLVPIVELNPDLIHPVIGKTMIELMENLDEEGQAVTPLGEA